MREIKFRGKHVETGEWVYGDLLQNNGKPIIVQQVDREYIGRTHVAMPSVGSGTHWHIETPAVRVEPFTIGQYTGLKDAEGREVWEGDILGGGTIIKIPDAYWLDTSWYARQCVIGNIHDNPELLQ